MKNGKPKISRRKFLLKGGAAVVTAFAASVSESIAKDTEGQTAPAAPPIPPPPEIPVSLSTVELNLTVNGTPHVLNVPAGITLAEILRQDLGLTGVKIGCGAAECGSCTVIVNSRPYYSCTLLAVLADNAQIETIEGISPPAPNLHPIQKAFIEKDALQCGFCTPGMICAAKALFVRNRRPNIEEIRDALVGNLCRCGAYPKIVEAVLSVRGAR